MDPESVPHPEPPDAPAFWRRSLAIVSAQTHRGLVGWMACLYLLAVLALSGVNYHQTREREYDRLNATLSAAAFALDVMLGPGFHDRHDREHPVDPVEYRAITQELNHLATALGLEYVYSMVRLDGQVRFVVSNETKEDLRRNTPSVFLSRYPDPPPSLLEAFESRDARSFRYASYTNAWDSYYSVFIPRDTPGGRRYILAADVKLADRRAILGESLAQSAVLVALLLLPLVPLVLIQKSLLQTRERIALQEHEHGRQIRELNVSLEATVQRRTAELEEALANLKDFSSSASHDLQAPLRAIAGFATALQEDWGERLDATGRDYLGRILAASRRMASLIDHLLRLAALAHAEVRWEAVDLSALAGEVVGELRQAGQVPAGAEVRVEGGLRMHGDAQLLRLVLQNLLSNALKYSRETPPPKIEVRGGTFGGGGFFEVRDNGTGFDPGYAHKLFRPFERLHDPSYGGHGLGLAQVARIVGKHGGRVTADSVPGEGSVFRVEIPEPVAGFGASPLRRRQEIEARADSMR